MSRSDPLTEMRRICLALPETAETMTWGQPHFRVRGKIFAGFGDHGGTFTIGFKLEREHADAAIQDPRFVRAPVRRRARVDQHGREGRARLGRGPGAGPRELPPHRAEEALGGSSGRGAGDPVTQLQPEPAGQEAHRPTRPTGCQTPLTPTIRADAARQAISWSRMLLIFPG